MFNVSYDTSRIVTMSSSCLRGEKYLPLCRINHSLLALMTLIMPRDLNGNRLQHCIRKKKARISPLQRAVFANLSFYQFLIRAFLFLEYLNAIWWKGVAATFWINRKVLLRYVVPRFPSKKATVAPTAGERNRPRDSSPSKATRVIEIFR